MIPALIEAALRALLVSFTVWGGLRLFRVTNVLAQKAAWGLMLAAAVAMPLLMRWQFLPASVAVRLPVPAWRQAPQPAPAATATTTFSAPAIAQLVGPQSQFSATPVPEPAAVDRFPAPIISSTEFNLPVQARPVPAQLDARAFLRGVASWAAGLHLPELGVLVGFLYLAVCGVLLLRIVYGLAMAARLWLASERFEPEPGPNPNNDPARGLHLRFSFAVSSPVTIGSGVLLPADCLGWDREKLRIVLAHERSHVRQGDFYLQLLAGVYTAVFWFSPLGWWLKRKLSDLGEAISDHAGLEEAASRTSYAQILLEFAALPRPTAIGVAMARNSNLSRRIERLLNESSFRQAFAGSSSRILLAIVLVPVALFAGTALFRVEAAQSAQVVQPPPPAAAPNPAPAPTAAPATPGQVADQAPPAPDAPAIAPSPDGVPAPQAAPTLAPVPPVPPSQYGEIHDSADDRAAAITNTQDDTVTTSGKSTSVGHGYSYSYSQNGDSWALVTDPSDRVTFSGDWHESTRDNIDKVRKLTNGKFLWFTHSGKSYFVDDPAIMAQIEAMYKPMDELGRQQEILGKQQEALGRQQEELGRKQEQASVPTPDISKEMAKLNEAVALLDAKKGSTVSQEELADIEAKIGAIQGRLGALQGEMGAKQGEFGAMQGKLGEQQGKLGAEQGRLGAQQGKLAEEADRKVKSIIDESLRDGKARPVE